METQIQFQASLFGICGQQGGIGVVFVSHFSPVTIIPPVLNPHSFICL
jgi:hypothetical protein